MVDTPPCPVCAASTRFAFEAEVLRRHDVRYFACEACGLLRTEPPYWLDEAYTEAISELDTGIVTRNQTNAAALQIVLPLLSLENGCFVDLAGGYGLLTRSLRDRGFNCFTTDPYCQNLFAKAFEPREGLVADALFAFEVMEHLVDPYTFLSEAFARYQCRTLVFSTLTYTGSELPPRDWWYYCFETGQHVSFYQPRTLEHLARRLGCTYHLIKPDLHVFSDRRIPAWRLRVLTHRRLRRPYAAWVRRSRRGKSLTMADHRAIRDRTGDSPQ